MERVVVLTECGKKEGFGHFFRTSGMVNFLREHGYEVDYLLLNSDGIIPVRDSQCIVIESHDAVDAYLTPNSAMIIDSYKTSETDLFKWKARCKKMLCFDDYSRINYPEYILNGAPYARELLYCGDKSHHLLGSTYLILRQEFLEVRPRECAKEVKNIFIMLGGTGSQERLNIILEKVKRLPYHFHIVAHQQLEADNFTYHQNLSAKEMALLMKRCEIAISASGQTLFELCYQGVPTILFKVAENQSWNIKWAKSVGMIEGNSEEIDAQLLALIPYEIRKAICKNIIDTVTNRGIVNVINAFLPLDILVRKAEIRDELAIFNLSNQEYVRKVSINKNKISLEDHQKWFRKKLSDNSPFYVIEDMDGIFLGQVRYQIEDKAAEISLSFSSILKERGLAKNIVEKSLNLLFNEYPLDLIIAHLYEDNIASKKLFERLGFECVACELGVLRYEWRRDE